MFAATWLGTAAATSGTTHPYCLFIDGLDVVRQPGSPGSIFGVDVDTAVISEQIGQPATLEFEIDDPLGVLTIRRNADVYFADHHGRKSVAGAWITDDLFRGFVSSVAKAEPHGTSGARWIVSCVDVSALLDRRVLTSGVIPAGLSTAAALSQVAGSLDGRISAQQGDPNALFVARINPTVNLIQTTAGVQLVAVPLAGKTAREALTDIAAASSVSSIYATVGMGYDVVDVDFQGRLRYGPDNGYPPFIVIYEGITASTTAPYNGRPVPEGVTYDEDSSALVNAVYVRGVDAASSGWITDDASIATYGRIEEYVEAPETTSAAARDSIGRSYLAAHRPIVRLGFTLSSTKDNLTDVVLSPSDIMGGWHVRQQLTVRSDSALFANLHDILYYVRRTFSGGGSHLTLELGVVGGPKAGSTAIASRMADLADLARSAPRLTGNLNEVAIRTKAGIPTDADFDIPRDGYVVVDTTNDVTWIRVNGLWVPPPGYEYAYQEFTAPVNVVATTEATANTIVTAPAVTFDGSTIVRIEFGTDYVQPVSAVIGRLWLYEDGASIGELAVWRLDQATAPILPPMVSRRRTPTAGSHTYSVRASTASGTLTVDAGAGGLGAPMPGYIRITRV